MKRQQLRGLRSRFAGTLQDADLAAAKIADFYKLRKNGATRGCRLSWRGPCPLHGGKSRKSLILSVSETDRLLVYCHAKCATEDIAAEIEADTGFQIAKFVGRDDAVLDPVSEAISTWSFSGRTAVTDKAVLRALLRICQQAGSIKVGASLRQLAELAKVQQIVTVSNALKRLEATGWIERTERASYTGAAVYRLRITTTPSSKADALRYNAAVYSELFRRTTGGLGPSAGRVFSAIIERGPIDARGIAKLLGHRDTQAARRQLRRLTEIKLVRGIPAPGRKIAYVPGPVSEFELEQERRLEGASAQQREKHDIERKLHQEWLLKRRRPRLKLVNDEVIDSKTGEVLMDRDGRMPPVTQARSARRR